MTTSAFGTAFSSGFAGLGPGSLILYNSHGLVAGDVFSFANVLPTDSGVSEGVAYYVIAEGLGADSFMFSTTDGGAPVILDNPIDSGDIIAGDTYEPITDTEHAMAPPETRHVTHSWPEAPGQPQNFLVAAAYKGLGARWDATSVGDLMFYEFRYAPDDGTGLAPNTTLWVKQQVKTSLVFVSNLTIDTLYWCQVRSIDFAGQVVTSAADATAVDYLANAEAGWTDAASVTPAKVPQEDVAFNSVLANIVSVNALDASTITSGLLTISASDANLADGLRIYDSDVLIGYWDETGLYIADTGGIPVTEANAIGDTTTANYTRLYDGGITVFEASVGVALDVLDETGLNASAITRGLLPGGPNILKNGSFEMTDFVAAATARVYTLTADFNGGTGTQGTTVSSTNVTVSDGITATAGTGTY